MYAAGLTLFHMQQGYKQGDLSLLCLTLVSSAGPHEWEAFALWTFFVSCRGHASSRSATNRRGNESRRGSRQHRKAQTDRPTGSPLAGPSFFCLFLNGYDSGRCVETFQFFLPSHRESWLLASCVPCAGVSCKPSATTLWRREG